MISIKPAQSFLRGRTGCCKKDVLCFSVVSYASITSNHFSPVFFRILKKYTRRGCDQWQTLRLGKIYVYCWKKEFTAVETILLLNGWNEQVTFAPDLYSLYQTLCPKTISYYMSFNRWFIVWQFYVNSAFVSFEICHQSVHNCGMGTDRIKFLSMLKL